VSEDFPGFPISISIDRENIVSLRSPTEVIAFCDRELSAWKILEAADFQHNGRAFDRIRPPIDRVQQACVNNLQSSHDQHSIQEVMQSTALLSSSFVSGDAIYSQTSLGKFIQSIARDYDVNIAAAVYIFALPDRNETFSFTKVSALAFSHLSNYYAGIDKKSASASVKMIQEKSAEFSKVVQDADSQSSALLDAMDSKMNAVDARVVDTSKRFAVNIRGARRKFLHQRSELAKENQEAISLFVSNAKEEIERFTELIKSQISLQGPTEYWETKRWWHQVSTFISGIVFVVYVVVCILIVRNAFLAKYGSIFDFLDHWKDSSLGAVALMGGVLAVLLMLARVMYRIFASQLHLWNDASERVTMIQTYLALAEKDHVKEESLGALLARLFSPASDGIVRDDLGAIGPIDLTSRIFGSKQ
jgi:hypothetical protein